MVADPGRHHGDLPQALGRLAQLADIYQRHRVDESWKWSTTSPTAEFGLEVINDVSPQHEAVLVLNVSGTIQVDEIPHSLTGHITYELVPNNMTAGPDILRNRAALANFELSMRELLSSLRGAVETVRAEREAAWEEAREQLQSTIAELREQASPLLDLLTEAQQSEFAQRIDEASVTFDATFDTGPSIEIIRARVAQLPALVDDLRMAIGHNQGKTVRRVAARELFSEPVRDEAELEALLLRIRAAAEEALKDDEYFLLT